jgi:hypothetical protein
MLESVPRDGDSPLDGDSPKSSIIRLGELDYERRRRGAESGKMSSPISSGPSLPQERGKKIAFGHGDHSLTRNQKVFSLVLLA